MSRQGSNTTFYPRVSLLPVFAGKPSPRRQDGGPTAPSASEFQWARSETVAPLCAFEHMPADTHERQPSRSGYTAGVGRAPVAVGVERKSLGLPERMGAAPKKEVNDSPNKTYPFPARRARADYLERSRVEVRHTSIARASDARRRWLPTKAIGIGSINWAVKRLQLLPLSHPSLPSAPEPFQREMNCSNVATPSSMS
jgi:hypothetical protein